MPMFTDFHSQSPRVATMSLLTINRGFQVSFVVIPGNNTTTTPEKDYCGYCANYSENNGNSRCKMGQDIFHAIPSECSFSDVQ